MCLFLTGCITTIDRKWAAVNAKTRNANMMFAEASIQFVDNMNLIIDDKHGLQEDHIDRDWEEFYNDYTDIDGNIPVDMVKARYVEALSDIDTLEISKDSWETNKVRYLTAIEQLKQATLSTEATDAEISLDFCGRLTST